MTCRWVKFGIGAALTATALVLSGCGGGGGGDGPTPAPTSGGGGGGSTPAPTAGPMVDSACPANFKRGHCSKCIGNGVQFECKECSDPYKLNSEKKNTVNACAFDCKSYTPTGQKPGMPDNALTHNGIDWQGACFDGGGDSEHFFVIGDWGGMCGGWDPGRNDCTRTDLEAWSRPGNAVPGKPFPMNNLGGLRDETDVKAGVFVANQMLKKAKELKDANTPPRFVVNVGDNFYPGGVMEHCSRKEAKTRAMDNKQFNQIFEAMYPIEELGNIEWMGVLGNHDYGGVCYTMGWDQQIYYTWKENGRWLLPGQYWSRKVQFKNFDAEFWFLDNNLADAKPSHEDTRHNICGYVGNPDGGGPGGDDRKNAHCAAKTFPPSEGRSEADCTDTDGPHNPDDCYRWFKQRWEEQFTWVTESLGKTTANWQIAVTHYPASFSVGSGSSHVFWPAFSHKYGIDLVIAGHVHLQEVNYKTGAKTSIGRVTGVDMGDVAWVVSGGGGGITSEGIKEAAPTDDGNDDGYGFLDMEISVETIKITAISHGGKEGAYIVRNETTIYPIDAGHALPLSALQYTPPGEDPDDELVV